LPSNRYMELELYMDAYRNQIIDNVEVLKKTDVFDTEGVLQRTSYIQQLEQTVQQMDEKIKTLEGDMQTRDRENVHLKQAIEVEKFKTRLNEGSTSAKKATQLYEERLNDHLTLTKEISKLQNKNGNTSN